MAYGKIRFGVIHTTETGAPLRRFHAPFHAPAMCVLCAAVARIRISTCQAACLAQELLDGYTETGVAYLDLSYYPTDALTEAGPAACVAGELKLVPGVFGVPSQVCCLHMDSCMQTCAWRCRAVYFSLLRSGPHPLHV